MKLRPVDWAFLIGLTIFTQLDHDHGPLLRVPPLATAVLPLIWIAPTIAFEWLYYRSFGGRFQSNSKLAAFCIFQTAIPCVREDLLPVVLVAYWLWINRDNFPWKKWKNKLGSKLSSLTEVAIAALKRQQSEAFS